MYLSLFFLRTKDSAIHEVLGQPNAPAMQGRTIAESSEAFQDYVCQLVMVAGGIEAETAWKTHARLQVCARTAVC